MGDITVRTATREDLPAILDAEQDWPEEQRAEPAALESRLDRFAIGFQLAFQSARLVAFSTACPVRYDPNDLSPFSSWKHATNDGFLYPPGSIRSPNALYVVSTLIRPAAEGGSAVFAEIAAAHLRTMVGLGFERVLTGATLPGYDAYCQKHGECSAAEYALMERKGRPRDPFLRTLAGFGLRVPDASHVIADYYPSPPSRDYGVLLAGTERDAQAAGLTIR